MLVCYILAGSLALLVLLYICFELNYFLRLILCVLAARLFKKRVHILQETTVTGDDYSIKYTQYSTLIYEYTHSYDLCIYMFVHKAIIILQGYALQMTLTHYCTTWTMHDIFENSTLQEWISMNVQDYTDKSVRRGAAWYREHVPSGIDDS